MYSIDCTVMNSYVKIGHTNVEFRMLLEILFGFNVHRPNIFLEIRSRLHHAILPVPASD